MLVGVVVDDFVTTVVGDFIVRQLTTSRCGRITRLAAAAAAANLGSITGWATVAVEDGEEQADIAAS